MINLLKKLKLVFKDDIVRRVFVKNTFDGIITVLGILIAFFFAKIYLANIVILSCLGSGIAMCISGIWGAYLTESTERNLKMKIIEKHLLTDLKKTKIGKRSKNSSIIVSLFDGLSPLIATLILLIPFFIIPLISTFTAYIISFIIALIMTIGLGVLLSIFGKEKPQKNVIKMVTAMITLSIILYLIELIKL
jgi:predicted membrane protein (TIGR00267 family)